MGALKPRSSASVQVGMRVSEAVIRLHCLPPPLFSEDAEPPGTNSWLPLIPEPREVGLRRRRRREEGGDLSPREELGSDHIHD